MHSINKKFDENSSALRINLEDYSEDTFNLKIRESERLIISGIFLIADRIHVGHWYCMKGVTIQIDQNFKGLGGANNRLRRYWKGLKNFILLTNN